MSDLRLAIRLLHRAPVVTTLDPVSIAPAARARLAEIDRTIPVTGVETLDTIVNESLDQPRFLLALLGVFAGVAFVLAALGLYGVLTHAVGQRTREIGVRIALGAGRRDIVRGILGEGLVLTMAGIGLGVVASAALTRLARSLLFEVSATDGLAFGGVVILVTLVAALSAWIPAARAARLDPMSALRSE